MRVALVQCPVWWTVDPPLGLAQIAGCVRQAGHEPAVFDLNTLLWKDSSKKYDQLWNWERFNFWNDPGLVRSFFSDNRALIEGYVQEILRQGAPVIGFSVCLGSQLASLELSRMIKSEDPGRRIVWGGQFFFLGNAAAEWIQKPEIDAIVSGAGDESFPELLASFARLGRFEPVPGTIVKEGGHVLNGGPAQAPRDLDRLPFPDFTGFPIELYTDQTRIPIAASRGCVWKCRFCSTTEFWSGYSYMSGDRIFAELDHQKKQFPKKTHVEFYDITANGNVQSLHRFTDLLLERMASQGWQYGWKINAIIRPEMTRELLDKMARSICDGVIYGVESGSPKVLQRMNKPFDLQVASRVLRDTHEAGIPVTANIMFGYPGEEEEDFEMTLEFLRQNHKWLNRAYGSATFTSLEEHSYLTRNTREFGIKGGGGQHNLYWESEDGRNNYEVRMQRYRRFRETATALGIDAYKGINGSLDQNDYANLADYHIHGGRHLKAIESLLRYLESDFYSEPMRAQLKRYDAVLPLLVQGQRLMERGRPEEALSAFARVPEPLRPRTQPDGLIWGSERLPKTSDLKDLRARIRLFLDLAESEVKRGEDKLEAASCRR